MIGPTGFSYVGPIEEVPAIKLEAGFGGPNLHEATSDRFERGGGQGQVAVLVVEDPIVVISSANFYLFIIGIHPVPYGVGGGEIEGGAHYRRDFTGGDKAGVDRRKVCRLEH